MNDDLKSQLGALITAHRGGDPVARNNDIVNFLADWADPGHTTGNKITGTTSIVDGRQTFIPDTPVFGNQGEGRNIGTGAALLDESIYSTDRQSLLGDLARIGGATPKRITDALDVHAAINRNVVDAPKPDIMNATAAEVPSLIADYLEAHIRIDAARRLNAEFVDTAARRILKAFNDSVGDVLADKKVREEFDVAAAEFAAAYPAVRGFSTVTDAATADDTGAGVAAFHKMIKARKRLDDVVYLVVGFNAERRHGFVKHARKVLDPSRVLGISAAPPLDNVAYLVSLEAHGVDGATPRPDNPFGVYGAQLDAECVLSLPETVAELNERRADFNIDAAKLARYFPDAV